MTAIGRGSRQQFVSPSDTSIYHADRQMHHIQLANVKSENFRQTIRMRFLLKLNTMNKLFSLLLNFIYLKASFR